MEGFGCAHHRVRSARNSQLSPRITCCALTRCFVASRLGSVCCAGSRSEADHVWRRESQLLLLERLPRNSRSPPFFTATWRLSRQPISDAWTTFNRSIPSRLFFFFAKNLSSFNPTTREQAVVRRHDSFKTACQKGSSFESREVGRSGHGGKCFVLNRLTHSSSQPNIHSTLRRTTAV